MDAVRKSVIDLIGESNEEALKDKLTEVLYSTKNPNAFIFKDTLESTRKEHLGDNVWAYECKVDVNLKAVRNTLEANSLMGSETAQAKPESTGEAKGDTPASPDYGEASRDEKAYIARYVDQMTYMVYFSDEIEEELMFIKAAVGKANEYLASQTMDTIDGAQIERLKQDQQTVYEEQTGQSISIIQWIAQTLNADIYIEIYGKTSGTTQLGGKHYGEASVEVKAYETSTAALMASASYTTLEKAFSQTSQNTAKLNAIQGAVYKTMPRIIDQAKANMAKALTRGIRYEIVIQNPIGDRAMSRFWSKLKDKVKGIKSLSQSPEEVKYYVWHIGSVDDLKSLIYDITETLSGLENLEMVMARGKSITFDTGF